jgi:hypothetical protein
MKAFEQLPEWFPRKRIDVEPAPAGAARQPEPKRVSRRPVPDLDLDVDAVWLAMGTEARDHRTAAAAMAELSGVEPVDGSNQRRGELR